MTAPNIRRVFEEFLEAQRARLAPKTVARYEAVLDLLGNYLNGYAYESLSSPEAARFERSYNAKGREHREFCDLFGPEKIVESLDGFLGYFMVRKVIAGEDLLRAAGTVTKKLSKWLVEKGYIAFEIGGGARWQGLSGVRALHDHQGGTRAALARGLARRHDARARPDPGSRSRNPVAAPRLDHQLFPGPHSEDLASACPHSALRVELLVMVNKSSP